MKDKKFIYIEQSLCSGCASCVSICTFVNQKEFNNNPANIIRVFSEEDGIDQVLANCDGSPCNNKPECISFCRTGALIWGNLQEIAEKKLELCRARRKYASACVRAPWK